MQKGKRKGGGGVERERGGKMRGRERRQRERGEKNESVTEGTQRGIRES